MVFRLRLVPFGVLILALSACVRMGALAPEAVLERTTLQSANLESAILEGDINFTANQAPGAVDGALHLLGSLSAGGHAEMYVQIIHLNGMPNAPAISGTWWSIPQAASAQRLTPDPRSLRAQAEIVTVTHDRGIESVDGKQMYHYDVTLDVPKLTAMMESAAVANGEPFDRDAVTASFEQLTMTGELWIDAENFFIERIVWDITSKTDPAAMRMHLDLDVRDHNAAVPLASPPGAQPLTEDSFLMKLLPLSPDV